MQNVDFSTAISFGDAPKSFSQSCLETVDSYFSLGGKKAVVISGNTEKSSEGTILADERSSFLVTALKLVSYLTIALPVVMLIAKALLRSMHSFYIIDAKKKIEEGIDIPQATMDKLQALMPTILKRDKAEGVNWIATGNNLIFSLQDNPNLIFKIAPPGRGVFRSKGTMWSEEIMEERFANMIKAKEVCIAHKLDHLVVPHAKKFKIDNVSIIAEGRLNINPNESAQEELYKLPGLDETAKELATFIAKTGFSDVEWRNMPLLDHAADFQGTRRVALIDLEEMEEATGGIFGGGLGRRGLVNCLFNEKQIDSVLAEANRQGLRLLLDTPENVKATRMEEIRTEARLQQFYADKGITLNPRKPIQIDDLASLGLDLNEQAKITVTVKRKTGTGEVDFDDEVQQITLKDAIVKIISVINKEIAKTPDDASTKGKRNACINFDKRELHGYFDLGIGTSGGFTITKEDEKGQWCLRILDALIAKGHIFNHSKYGRNYIVQA
jgi:Family of unknown function (DUF648)